MGPLGDYIGFWGDLLREISTNLVQGSHRFRVQVQASASRVQGLGCAPPYRPSDAAIVFARFVASDGSVRPFCQGRSASSRLPMYIYIYIYLYVCIHREREKHTICVYIYIH